VGRLKLTSYVRDPVVYQVCTAERTRFSFEVPSRSKPGKTYTVSGEFADGVVSCTCPAFTFQKTCSHIRMEKIRCGWHSGTSPEAQTLEQKRAFICPVCGSRTERTLQGRVEPADDF